eukprot:CFRG2768T1
MHPRNKHYKEAPDFGELAEKYPALKPHLIPVSGCTPGLSPQGDARYAFTINFKNVESMRELLYALVKVHYGLELRIPLDRLIPTVTSRENYIHWIADLLSRPVDDTQPSRNVSVLGFDVGVGSSCIYPLLGNVLYGWSFEGSELDPTSLEYAISNVATNKLQDSIKLIRVYDKQRVLCGVLDTTKMFDFTMCNPPFYVDNQEAEGGALAKAEQPHAVCVGSQSEMITDGGEVGFVNKMIDDSLFVGARVAWFTTMLGKKSSLAPLLDKLQELGVQKVKHTSFYQGRTVRWALAWSLTLPNSLAPSMPRKKETLTRQQTEQIRSDHSTNTSFVPSPRVYTVALHSLTNDKYSISYQLQVYDLVLAILKGFEIVIEKEEREQYARSIFYSACKHTWSRKYRREKKRRTDDENEVSGEKLSPTSSTKQNEKDTSMPSSSKQPENEKPLFKAKTLILSICDCTMVDRSSTESKNFTCVCELQIDVRIVCELIEGDEEKWKAFLVHFQRGINEISNLHSW